MLVLPLCFVVVFSFGEREAAGGYVPAFTFAQYANLPARGTAFLNTLMLAPLGHGAVAADRLSTGLFSGHAGRSEMAHAAADPGHRAVLDLDPDPQLCVDLHSGRAGLCPALIDWLGLGQIRLINTPFAVLTGIVYGYLPLMVLPSLCQP
jgi:spermidine/putrescine transport system permease protein